MTTLAGYTVAQLLIKICNKLDWTTTDETSYTKVYQAITACGLAASTWKGETWWWQYAWGKFYPYSATIATVANEGAVRATNTVTITTTAAHGLSAGNVVRISGVTDGTMNGTFEILTVPSTTTFTYTDNGDDSTSGAGYVYSSNYTLRSVNSNDMATLLRVLRVYYDDDHPLKHISIREYRNRIATGMSMTENRPTEYTVTGKAPILHLLPVPNTTDPIFVDYIQSHGAISSGTDTDLIVPPEYQEGVYVDGPLFILRRDVGDIATLDQCPGFAEAMGRMYQSRPESYDDDPSLMMREPGGGSGAYPHDARVTEDEFGYHIWNDPSL